MNDDELGSLADLPVGIEIEIDRLKMTVRQILALGKGSLIKTSRAAGDSVDVFVGGVRVGYGEIIVLESVVGVRITNLEQRGKSH